MMKWRKVFCVVSAAAFCFLSGCDIHMNASERVGSQESGKASGSDGSVAGAEEGSGETAEITKMPVLTVGYQPYDIYDVAEKAFGMQPDEVDRNLDEYGQLAITPQDKYRPLANTGIMIYTDGLGVVIRFEDNAEGYWSVFHNALLMARNSKDAFVNTDYSCVPSDLAIAFPMDEEKQAVLEDAAEKVSEQLQEYGFDLSSWYGGVTDADFWEWYSENGGHLYEDFTPEDEVCYLNFRVKADGHPIEDMNQECLIYVVYSVSRQKMLLMDAYAPLPGKVQSEKQVDIISESDAELLAQDIMKRSYNITDPKVTDAELVYVAPGFGWKDSDNKTMTIVPAWKVGYAVTVDGVSTTDYIYLNAETGIQFSNKTPL
ncbi:MAG: hypothetical protein ACOX8B_06375 [Lachnospiraceae bacterium]|jgi:hypothetical protein